MDVDTRLFLRGTRHTCPDDGTTHSQAARGVGIQQSSETRIDSI